MASAVAPSRYAPTTVSRLTRVPPTRITPSASRLSGSGAASKSSDMWTPLPSPYFTTAIARSERSRRVTRVRPRWLLLWLRAQAHGRPSVGLRGLLRHPGDEQPDEVQLRRQPHEVRVRQQPHLELEVGLKAGGEVLVRVRLAIVAGELGRVGVHPVPVLGERLVGVRGVALDPSAERLPLAELAILRVPVVGQFVDGDPGHVDGPGVERAVVEEDPPVPLVEPGEPRAVCVGLVVVRVVVPVGLVVRDVVAEPEHGHVTAVAPLEELRVARLRVQEVEPGVDLLNLELRPRGRLVPERLTERV